MTRPQQDTSTRAGRVVAAAGRYARQNVLALVAIVIASSGTALAATSLPGDSVDSAAITKHGVRRSDIAPGAVGGAKIRTDTVTGRAVDEQSLDSGVLQRRVAAGCPVGASIRAVGQDGSVTCQVAGAAAAAGPAGGDLTGSYPDPTIAGGAVGSGEVADGSLTGTDLAAGAVGPGQLANGAVGTPQLANGAVGTPQLATGAVGPDQLADVPAGRALQTTAQAFPAGGPLVHVQLSAAQYARGVTFDGDNDQFVITTPGVYLLTGEVLWTSDANGLRFAAITGSGGEYVTDTRPAVDGYATLQSLSTVQQFGAGNVVFLQAGTSSPATTDTASSGRGATLGVTYLGPARAAGRGRAPATAQAPRSLG